MPPDSTIPPLVRVLALALRVRASAACIFQQSLGWIVVWSRREISFRNETAEAVRAIDDPLESKAALLEQALANDPPAVRREILSAYREMHCRTERHAAALRIQLPLSLQQDNSST